MNLSFAELVESIKSNPMRLFERVRNLVERKVGTIYNIRVYR